MTRRSLYSILLIAAVAMTATSALACTCTNTPTPASEFALHDSVFTGRVQSIHTIDAFNIAVQIQVYSVWKGPVSVQIVVTTAPDGAMCGASFVVGEEYLVYGGIAAGDMVFTHLCTRTRPMTHAQEDLLYLGTPSTVAAGNLDWGMLKESYR